MKVSELLESQSVLLNEGPIANKLWTKWHKILKKAETDLKKHAGKQSSHSIGGNFSAVVSGNVGIRDNYTEHGSYGMNTGWNFMLEIGNNLEGKKSLDEAKKIFDDLLDVANSAEDAKVYVHDSSLSIDIDGGRLAAKYEYARSFCWVGIRVVE